MTASFRYNARMVAALAAEEVHATTLSGSALLPEASTRTRKPLVEWFGTLLDRVRADASGRGAQDVTAALARTRSAAAAPTRMASTRATGECGAPLPVA
ncbi:hypothetical protein [Cryobacterium tepidiphilum]|uniref:Uncharacterized protein n=1 Tax=Cryobacterium tepidiphilum TaxID=2486026 RepID=A0A3M8LC55_9MICO|nr:hypothetical protein [Cryobacterium tepidiphilum]RNE62362.1 hypothetical protein EEJ31_08125 [Cryobacterium tepidiphilum]